MNSRNPNDKPFAGNTSNSSHTSSLLAETEAYVREFAKIPGNFLAPVGEVARRIRDAAERGARVVAQKHFESAQRRWSEVATHLHEARTRLQYTEPKIIVKGKRSKVGFVGCLVVLMLLVGLVILLWIENGAAAQALLATGAFDVDTLERARVVMVTPVLVGIAFVLGFRALPPFVRRTAVQVACAALVLSFVIWAVSFASEAQRYRQDASQTISLSDETWTDSAIGSREATQHGDGWAGWLMFGSLVVMMPLTSFLGHAGVEHFLSSYETWDTNPDYSSAFESVQIYESALRQIDQEIAAAAGKLATFEASVDREITLARALYTSLHNTLSSFVVIALAGMLLTGCAESFPGGGRTRNDSQLDRWANRPGAQNTEVTRVLAISPLLPPAEKAIAREQLEAELTWIASDAPVGSVTVVVDGLECVPIARLEAVPGVSRIRKKALVKPVLAIREFLNQPHPRFKDDGRIHFPRLAQTAKQWGLPKGSHVVVLGNPLFLNDGKDKFFSMADGRVPSDGCLFEDPQLNLYSVLGREKALTGQYWHLGWSNDAVFEDDTHRQSVLRFWFLYFQAQSALLVTAQPSFVAATDAAREHATDPLMYAEPDSSARAAMVKIIKVQHQEEEKVVPKAREHVQPQADAVHGPQQVDTELTAAQPPRETANVQDEEVPHNELIDIDASVPELARDEHDNVQGSDNDLIIDGQMVGQKIVLATFYSADEVESSPLTAALTAKGFSVERIRLPLPPLSAFELMLDESEQLWLWSSAESDTLPSDHLRAIVDRWKAGKLALCLLADNTPFTSEASKVLSAVSPGCTISGNYRGEHKLHARLKEGDGFDPASPLFHNITTLYEGATVSTMSGPGLMPVCYASDGSPLIATLQREGSSRIVVHGGFTSFFERFWDDAGISRFAVNCAGWLNGADVKLECEAE